MRYIYCPECGRKLTEKEAGDDGPVPYCEGCGKYWFDSFSSCVIVMVVNDQGEIVIIPGCQHMRRRMIGAWKTQFSTR